MKIEVDITGENEGTSYPYWLILDPSQNMRADIHDLACQITGPFFSRATAEAHLKERRYEFSKRAAVYCKSGYWAKPYVEAVNAAKKPATGFWGLVTTLAAA